MSGERSGSEVDWLEFLKDASTDAKVDLRSLCAGDVLLIDTKNTIYRLEVLDPGERFVEVTTNREDRPMGWMRLMGCTFGLSSTIAPDDLFCGGNVEMTTRRDGESVTHTTTEIRRVVLVSRSPGE